MNIIFLNCFLKLNNSLVSLFFQQWIRINFLKCCNLSIFFICSRLFFAHAEIVVLQKFLKFRKINQIILIFIKFIKDKFNFFSRNLTVNILHQFLKFLNFQLRIFRKIIFLKELLQIFFISINSLAQIINNLLCLIFQLLALLHEGIEDALKKWMTVHVFPGNSLLFINFQAFLYKIFT